MQFRDLKKQYQVLKKDIDTAMIQVATAVSYTHLMLRKTIISMIMLRSILVLYVNAMIA